MADIMWSGNWDGVISPLYGCAGIYSEYFTCWDVHES